MFQSESYIKPIKDVPDDVYWQALEASAMQRIEALKAAKAYNDAMQSVRKEYLDELYSIVGEDNLQQYLTLHKKRIEKMRSVTIECPPTVEGYKKIKDIRRRTVEQSIELINKSKVDVSNVKTLQETYRDKAFKVFSETIGKGEIVTKEPSDNLKNTDFEPPYSGWSWDYSWSWSKSGGLPNPSYQRYLDHTLGRVGSYSYTQVTDADNSDYVQVLYRTAVRQWYRVPKIGQVRVKVELESIDTPYWGSIEDECGWSEIDLVQQTRVYAQVTVPVGNPRIYLWHPAAFENRDTNESSHSWSWARGPAGILSSSGYNTLPGAFDSGTWVVVDVGIETWNYFLSNDCTVRSGITQKYLVRKIGITTT